MANFTGRKSKRIEHAIELRLYVRVKDKAEADRMALALKSAVVGIVEQDFKLKMAYTGVGVDVLPLE